jgi:hypothetical protein
MTSRTTMEALTLASHRTVRRSTTVLGARGAERRMPIGVASLRRFRLHGHAIRPAELWRVRQTVSIGPSLQRKHVRLSQWLLHVRGRDVRRQSERPEQLRWVRRTVLEHLQRQLVRPDLRIHDV